MRISEIRSRYSVGARMVVRSSKINSIAKCEKIKAVGVITGIYPNLVEVEYPSGVRESFTWGECVVEKYCQIGE